jgi:membrane dipeptidase
VGIGSDFEGIEITPEGLEDISKLGELELSLAKVGFNQQEIKQILGENSVRVIEKVLK